ncbi:hypothetical protein GW755_01310 [bacterium]|nr:hypothetical protein [bacterium]
MKKRRLTKSLITILLLSIVAIPTTYASLVTNTVALAGNTVNTATAEMAICNKDGVDSWMTTLTGQSFTVSNLAPGSISSLFTDRIYVGNDGGNLDSSTGCSSYDASYTPGTSAINMEIVPSLTNVNCGSTFDLQNALQVEFVVGGVSSDYQSLNNWSFNSTAFGSTLLPDDAQTIEVNTKLSNDFDVQGGTCSFDLQLKGRQI